MKTEKVIKREDGTRVSIEVSLSIDMFRDTEPRWTVRVTTCEKGKKTWHNTCKIDEYRFRKMTILQKQQALYDSQLTVCTEQEIYDVKMMLWNALKPSP